MSSGFNCKRGEKVDQVYDEYWKSEITICRKFSAVLIIKSFTKCSNVKTDIMDQIPTLYWPYNYSSHFWRLRVNNYMYANSGIQWKYILFVMG